MFNLAAHVMEMEVGVGEVGRSGGRDVREVGRSGDRGIGRELRERKSHSHLFHAPRKLQTYPGPYLIWTQQGADLVEMFGQNDTSVLETPKRAMAKAQ